MCPVVTIYVVTHRLDERLMFMVGLFLVAFGFFALLPMGNEFPLIATSCMSLSKLALV